MAEKDITQIKVGRFAVSIVGIKQLMEEMAGTHADKTDDEVRSFMLDRLGQGNYIPAAQKRTTAKLLLGSFESFLGSPTRKILPMGSISRSSAQGVISAIP